MKPPVPPWIAAQTRWLLAQPGHAWLLQGPAGLGQYELALALVRAWLCDAPTPGGACGACASCHAIDVHTHADLSVLMPETVMLDLGWPLSEKAQDAIDKKERKPSKEIRVDALRDAVDFAQRTSARGRGKVALIYPAERMNAISANTLLKTLEEPAGEMRFVLASEAAHLLLPTIRSRCLTHTLDWPGEAEALAWLSDCGYPAAEAAVLLRAAGGRPAQVLRHAIADARQAAQRWSQLPRAVAQGQTSALADFSPAQAIDALQKLCHDLQASCAGAAPRFFSPADLPPLRADAAQLSGWSRALVQAARTAEHPYNPGLMLEALLSQASRALRGTDARSFSPLKP